MVQKVHPVDPDSDEAAEIKQEFDKSVNMTASEIEKWLETDASQAVGQKDGGGDSVGRDSAKRIIRILRKRKGDLTGQDYGHMKKTNGYLARHLGQRPNKSKDELRKADWTYSLKNWGHDPLR